MSLERRFDEIDPKLLTVMRELSAGEREWPLLIFGEAGLGKTRAALALCDVCDSAAYYTVESLADSIMASGRQDNTDPFEDCDSGLAVKEMAVLDEIGERGKPTDLHYQAIKKFADCREFHKHSVAVYITNARPEELADLFDDRIASRLTAGTVFELEGKDRRRDATAH